ncbi:MAG: hypothetical protein JWN25_2841 [Verrucomicrobiales bacterium]|nr:hypothetical protein [Verrucomicrobiales bacterium]
MRFAFNFTIILVAAVAGLAIGRFMHPVPSNQITASNAASDGSFNTFFARFFQRVKKVKADDSPLATKLARDLSLSSGVTHWLQWMDALENANLSDFPRLVQLAKGNPTLLKVLSARWIEKNPRNLYDTLLASGDAMPKSMAYDLFAEWPKRDLEGVIAALSATNSLNGWRMGVAGDIVDIDVERGLGLMMDWHIENFTPRLTKVASWAATDARHAAEFAMSHPAGFASSEIMKVIGNEWAKQDPAAAMEFAASHPGNLSSALAESVLKEWSKNNLNDASKWLGATDATTRNRLSSSFVESWARQDASAAMSWSEQSLTGNALARAVGAVVKSVGEKNIQAGAALVAEMTPSIARAEAASAIANKWIPQDFFSSEKQPIPNEAIAWLKTLDSDSTKRALENTYWRWTELDPKGLANFISGLSPDAIPEGIYNTLARSLARQNPKAAMEWTQKLPEANAAQASTEAFSEWRNSQPAAAMKWLAALPDSDTQKSIYYQRVISNLSYDPLGAEQLASWTPSEKATAQPLVEQLAIMPDKKAKLLEALKVK